MNKSNTTLQESEVIRKFGNWTLEIFFNDSVNRYQLVASNGWVCMYPIIYEYRIKKKLSNKSAWDFVPVQSIINYVEKNAKRLSNILANKNGEEII